MIDTTPSQELKKEFTFYKDRLKGIGNLFSKSFRDYLLTMAKPIDPEEPHCPVFLRMANEQYILTEYKKNNDNL